MRVSNLVPFSIFAVGAVALAWATSGVALHVALVSADAVHLCAAPFLSPGQTLPVCLASAVEYPVGSIPWWEFYLKSAAVGADVAILAGGYIVVIASLPLVVGVGEAVGRLTLAGSFFSVPALVAASARLAGRIRR